MTGSVRGPLRKLTKCLMASPELGLKNEGLGSGGGIVSLSQTGSQGNSGMGDLLLLLLLAILALCGGGGDEEGDWILGNRVECVDLPGGGDATALLEGWGGL